MLGWFILAVIIVLMVMVGVRNANHRYTFGSGMFKNSEGNLEKEKHIDIADYEYYNKQDKLR